MFYEFPRYSHASPPMLQHPDTAKQNEQLLSQSGNFQKFMEPEGSLPSSQKPATCPYHIPDESNFNPRILFNIHFSIILTSILRSSKLSLLLRFSYENSPVCGTQPHPPRLSHRNNIGRRPQIMNLLVVYGGGYFSRYSNYRLDDRRIGARFSARDLLHCVQLVPWAPSAKERWPRLTTRRSQWPGSRRHEPSSPVRTLVPWVRILLEAWMSVCVYSVFVLFYV
jgi:hypothetical protein